jgi:hypothetical protein
LTIFDPQLSILPLPQHAVIKRLILSVSLHLGFVMAVISDIILSTPAVANSPRNLDKPPPKVVPVQDPPFKGYQPPQPDGYEQSKASPDSSAIVIDNGWFFDV